MDTLEFFERVLPETGTYCAFGVMGDRVKQSFASTLADLIAQTTKLDTQGFDTYQAMATIWSRGSYPENRNMFLT